ncbi:MAG: hypothetical protein ACK5M1_03155 [Xanthomarina gelatinilytica]|uniref:hypothetical protein n=1 Tax=Xanthomarina gelatinilytica TaxID=1137281 RepID=UPI003A847E8B
MFLSHLVFILSVLGFILFIVRSNKQEPFELFLTFFSFLFFTSSGVWLYLDYYSQSSTIILDYYGVINENLALLSPVFVVMLFGKSISKIQVVKCFGLTFFIGFGFAFLQYLISDDNINGLIFFPTNKNLSINAVLQIIYNLTLFVLFLHALNKIKLTKDHELFDGNYKRAFSTLFIVYYILDTTYFFVLLMYFNNTTIFKNLYYVMLVSNLIMTLLIITLAIYTNWLFLITRFKRKWLSESKSIIQPKEVEQTLYQLDSKKKVTNWNDFKQNQILHHEEVITNVESLEFLTKTEKLYAALQPFNLAHKELANLLNVSLRTIETNFYRLKMKLRKQGYSEDYPYIKN